TKTAADSGAILRHLREIITPEAPLTKLEAKRRRLAEVPNAYPEAFEKAWAQLEPLLQERSRQARPERALTGRENSEMEPPPSINSGHGLPDRKRCRTSDPKMPGGIDPYGGDNVVDTTGNQGSRPGAFVAGRPRRALAVRVAIAGIIVLLHAQPQPLDLRRAAL